MALRTSSSLNGLMIAVTSFIELRPPLHAAAVGPVRVGTGAESGTDQSTAHAINRTFVVDQRFIEVTKRICDRRLH
jgi:hypothetical protein